MGDGSLPRGRRRCCEGSGRGPSITLRGPEAGPLRGSTAGPPQLPDPPRRQPCQISVCLLRSREMPRSQQALVCPCTAPARLEPGGCSLSSPAPPAGGTNRDWSPALSPSLSGTTLDRSPTLSERHDPRPVSRPLQSPYKTPGLEGTGAHWSVFSGAHCRRFRKKGSVFKGPRVGSPLCAAFGPLHTRGQSAPGPGTTRP